MKLVKPNWKSVLADLVVVASLVPIIVPELAGAPPWVAKLLTVFALVVARLNAPPVAREP